MKPSIKLTLIIGLLNLVVFSSCRREGFHFEYEIDGVVYPGSTKIIQGEDLEMISDVSSGQIVFNGSTSTIKSIKVDDILLIGAGKLTPYGSIRRVTEISSNGTTITLSTSDASVCDAIKSGTITFSEALTGNDFEVLNYSKGVADSKPEKSFTALRTELNHEVVYNSNGKLAWMDGVVAVSPEINIVIEIEDFAVKKVTAKSDITRVEEVYITSDGPFSGQGNKDVSSFKQKNPTSVAGLIFTPMLSVKCGFDGSVSGTLYNGVRKEVKLDASITLDNGQVSHSFGSNDLVKDFETPVLSSNSDMSVLINQVFTICLSGSDLFELDISGYQQLQSDKTWDKWWNLYIGYKGNICIKSGILNGGDDYSEPVEIPKVNIGSAEGQYSGS